jgi:hypothetical protein
MPKEEPPEPDSVHVCPGSPRIVRFVLVDEALDPEQLKPALGFAPNGLAVMPLLPGVTEIVVDPMPHDPPHV